jgi:hypothetical protein
MKHPIIITSGGSLERRDKYDRNSIIAKYLASSTGRQALASSMIAPIRRSLDYQGIARQVFAVQQLPQGAAPAYVSSGLPSGNLPVYDSDLVADIVVGRYKYDAIRISSRGRLYRKGQLSGAARRVTIPQFQLYASPTIKLSDVKSRRFNLIDRATYKLKQSIMAEEDSMIFDILDKVGK